jgi:galactoside O-acetyltransferase
MLDGAMKPILRRLANRLARSRAERHSTAAIAPSAQVNWRGVRLRRDCNLVVGAGSIFEGQISADREGACIVIGHRTFIGNSLLVTAERIEIGSDVLISWGCTIVDHDSHHLEWSLRSRDVDEYRGGRKSWEGIAIRPVKIEDKAWIGFNVIILKGVSVGEGAVVAAGSVVTRDVPPYTLVAGNPARSIRDIQRSAT